MNPVSWWHDLEGGKIAEERPPPPGADQPYPNLASVPPKPAAPDRAALANIASALVADRTNAQHVAAAAPIADPSSPSASPELFGKGTVPPPAPPPPPGSQQASATMPAVEAPPAPAAPPAQASQPASRSETPPPPAKAPVGDVQSTPIAPPGATAQPTAQAAAPPSLPAAPPPPPNLPGTPPAPAITAAPPPPATAPAAPAPAQVAAATPSSAPAGKPANTVSVTFVNGSAELPSFAADTLKQLAGRRGNGVIAVTGYGDATSDDPDAQSAALALGLSRAKAMATALTKAGEPASAVQVDAEAVGRGGTARLVQ
jgi:outer membrane protein OmpA-like peptidoglycan-associated protein